MYITSYSIRIVLISRYVNIYDTMAPMSRIEAQEEADRLNIINQSVIGAKEGVTEGVTNKVGGNIADTILRTSDGSNHKSVDDYTSTK